MRQVLLKEKKYSGKYVAIKNFNKPVVIAYGKNPEKVYKEAVNKKHIEPLIVFVPTKDMVQIY